MHSRKTIVYAIIAALVGILAIAGLLAVNDADSTASQGTNAQAGNHSGTLSQSSATASASAQQGGTQTTATASGTYLPTATTSAAAVPQPPAPEPGWPRTITDSRGDTTTLERRPRRIVSLAPSATQILRAIGADGALVAIPREGSDPSEAADLVRVQVYPAPSPESILSLSPDLLVGADITSPAVAARLRALGLPLVILNGNNYEGILGDIAHAGKATGSEATADILRQILAAQFESVRAEVAAGAKAGTTEAAQTAEATARPQVLLFIGETPDYAAGRGSYAADLLDIAGGDNMALRLSQPWPQLSREFILEANPQVLVFTVNAAAITSAHGAAGRAEPLTAFLRSHPIWSQLDAVRSNRVYVIDQNLLNVPGPQVGEALTQLRAIIRDAEAPRPQH